MTRKKTEGELLTEMRDCFEKHGEISRTIFNNDKAFSSGKTIYNHFGSFADACNQAGLPHNDKPQKKEKVEVKCENCGNNKLVYPYRLNENTNNRFFCDNECQGQWWSDNLTGESHPLYEGGGEWSNKLGAKWHKVRDKCLDRDNYSCKVCGVKQSEHIEQHDFGLDVHHIEPRRKFCKSGKRSIDEANKMDNLITLCREHHLQAEHGNIDIAGYM